MNFPKSANAAINTVSSAPISESAGKMLAISKQEIQKMIESTMSMAIANLTTVIANRFDALAKLVEHSADQINVVKSAAIDIKKELLQFSGIYYRDRSNSAPSSEKSSSTVSPDRGNGAGSTNGNTGKVETMATAATKAVSSRGVDILTGITCKHGLNSEFVLHFLNSVPCASFEDFKKNFIGHIEKHAIENGKTIAHFISPKVRASVLDTIWRNYNSQPAPKYSKTNSETKTGAALIPENITKWANHFKIEPKTLVELIQGIRDGRLDLSADKSEFVPEHSEWIFKSALGRDLTVYSGKEQTRFELFLIGFHPNK